MNGYFLYFVNMSNSQNNSMMWKSAFNLETKELSGVPIQLNFYAILFSLSFAGKINLTQILKIRYILIFLLPSYISSTTELIFGANLFRCSQYFKFLKRRVIFLPRFTPKQLDSPVQKRSNVKLDDNENCAMHPSLCSQSTAKKSVSLLLGSFSNVQRKQLSKRLLACSFASLTICFPA